MTSEISWNNQSSSISSSSTSSTSFNDYYYYDRSHHLHYLFRYPYKQKLQSTQETEVKQFQHKDDVRIKLESELCQKVREAVKTPPRERLIRRRLNEFQYEVRKRLEGEKQKKHLATQMNEVITLGLISGIHSVDNPLNMNKEVGIMDLRLHPESYQQNLGWYKQSDTKVNSQRIQWNKKNIFTEGKFKKIKFLLIDQKECKSGSDSMEATSIDTHEGSLKNLNKMITFRDTFNRNDPLLCLNTTPDIVKGYYHSNIDQVNTDNDNNQRMNISSLRSCSHTIWNRLEEIKKPSVYIKQPLNNSMDTITSLIRFQHDNEYKLILNDTFTFNWNTIIYNDNSINQSTNEYLHQYLCNYNLLADYLSYEDVQLLNKYSKLYQSKLLLDKKSNRSKQCHIVTRQSVLEQFGRLTDDEKQLFYFSATRAAYLMGSSEPQHKLPDGTQYRLVNQSEIQPLDSIIINNLFIDPINQFHSETGNVKKLTNHCINIPNNTTNTSRQAKNSVYTLPTFIDWSAVVRDRHGPFWPQGYGPICQILHNVHAEEKGKHINNNNKSSLPDYTEELNQLRGRQTLFKGIQVVYDSETSPYLLQSQDSSSSSSSSGSVNMHQLIKDTEDINQWSPPCLIFESRFESGNLRQVRRIGPFHYELLLKPDLYTKRHVQWYFFCIRNTLPGFTYTFLIINFTKPTSLYSQGLQPLLYSKINTQQNGKKWIRIGKNIKYTRNTTNLTNHLLDTSGEYYQLEWDMEFPYADDICYLAYSYPYTYTQLKYDLNELLLEVKKDETLEKTIKCEVLCQTRAGNSCFLITITDENISNKEKYAVVITGRVHPGETNSSWMILGFIRFLMDNNKVANELKQYYTFYIIPMMNPDGVIVGNYRCSLTGRDLNRNYRQPRKDVFPTVWTVKQLVKWCKKMYKDVIYCDMHGHSRRNNIFMYGCDPSNRYSKIFNTTEKSLQERILPYIISQQASRYFSFANCRFTIHPCKEATSRVVFWREFEVVNSFTLEATFNGSTLENKTLVKFDVTDFLEMGEKLGHSLYTFHETISNPGKLKQTLTNLARETLINLYKTRIPLIPDQHTITKEYTDNNNNNGISRDFLSPELKINNFHGLKSYSSSPTERLLPWNNQFDKKLLRNSTTILYNKDDDDAINTFETVVKVIRLLEKSIEFKTIQLDEDDENSIHENSSSTSNSNSDSEPEMIFTTENYLNYKFNFRGDYILHNQTEKEINNEINQMNHLTVDKTNEMNKLKKRRRRKTHHHHFHRRRRHHQQQQQKSSFQQNSKNDISYHTPIPLSSSTSSSLAAPSVQQLDHTHTHTHNNNNNKHYQKETGVKINTQNNREMQNRGLYFVSRYAGQSNRGIPCFVEKRLFHRSCQKIRSVWKKIDLTNPQTLHAQQKFVERFTASLETRINQLQKDGTLSIDILKYLKQIHFEAQQQIQFIHNHLQITNRNTYKSLSVSSHGIGLPPPPLPVFTTGYHMKTYSPIIGGGGGGDNKRSYSIGVMNNPQSKSCNLFIRHHKHLIDTTNSLSIIKLPKINDTNTPEN